MPIKLNDPNKAITKRLKRTDLRDMVKYHRNNASLKKLNYAQFELNEVLALFRDNGAIDFAKPLNSQLADIKRYGVKLYPGTHFKPETCIGKPGYLRHSTIIICTTEVDQTNFYNDMLDDNKNHSISMAGFADALDLAQICQPDCGNTDDVAQ